MSKRKKFGISDSLSQGLTDTINIVENDVGLYRNVVIPIDRLEPDPENPRKLGLSLADIHNGIKKSDVAFEQKNNDREKILSLAESIKKSGLINPIVVYKKGEKYRIVAGERRYLATLYLNKTEIEARVFQQRPNSFELKLIQWYENTERDDLSLHERIENIRALSTAYNANNTQAALSTSLLHKMTGLSLSQASCYLSVLSAPTDIATAIQVGAVTSLDKAALLANCEKAEVRDQLLVLCKEGKSLKALRKAMAELEASAKPPVRRIKTPGKRGKKQQRVNMGHTTNTRVIQIIMDAVLATPAYQGYAKEFAKVDWSAYESVNSAFNDLVRFIELEETKKA